ncbi:MAG: hypothetical protein KF862_11930 [Chitinophagaceae bacterium]|nr:hypothetical protein [Chitinophagaceae bacterium]
MKKIITVLSIAGIAFASCKKDKGVDCTAAAQKAATAGQAFANSQTKANCDAYKAAMQEYIKSSCFTNLSQEQKDALSEDLESLDCTDPE